MNPTSGGILPDVYTNPTVAVTFPNGTQATVPNPLASYKFHPLVPGDLQVDLSFILGYSGRSNVVLEHHALQQVGQDSALAHLI
jgi:hypothetical protein